jgi:endonuclease YncB( thermonuclease family)
VLEEGIVVVFPMGSDAAAALHHDLQQAHAGAVSGVEACGFRGGQVHTRVRLSERRVPRRREARRPARNPPPLRFWPEPPAWRRHLRRVLLLILLVMVVAGIAFYRWANRPPPVTEQVGEQFTRCGYGRGHGCVVDGDTFRLGERTLRVAGIDAAELAGQCPEDTARAEASTRALQDWLNRGPFTITAGPGEPTDKYGRELVSVTRDVAGGGEERLDEYMTREGGAQRYDGGARGGWY